MSGSTLDGEQTELLACDDIHRAVGEWSSAAPSDEPPVDVSATSLGLRAWTQRFGSDAVTLYRLHGGGKAMMLLPLARRTRRVLGMAMRVWSSPGNFYWQFAYPIGGADLAGSIASLLGHLGRRRDWDLLQLGPLLTSSPHYAALLSSGARLGMRPEVCARKPDPVVLVRGNWSEYYAGRSGGLREKIGQGERRLAREGAVSFVRYTGGPELTQRLREFYDLEASGWKGRKGTAIASDPAVEAFYTDLAREAAAEGRLRLYALRVDDALIACDFAIACGGVIHLLKIAYDERRQRCSPGHVIRKRVLQQLFEEREASVYDLMTGGGEHADYKLRWANDSREYVVLRLSNPATIRARVARGLMALRRMMRRRVPASVQP